MIEPTGKDRRTTARPYNERRNKEIMVLVERRRFHPKDIPAELESMGYGILTYDNVRKIISLQRKFTIIHRQ